MNRLFIAGALAASALASVPAFAQGYVGANVGVSHANRGCGAADATGTAFSCDKNDTAYKLYGGWQMPGTPWAAELSYVDLGKFNASGGTGIGASAKDSYWGLGAAYRPDFGAGWGGVARFGAAYGSSKVDYSLAGGSGGETKHGWHPYYGLGVNYALTRNVKLEADWDNTRITSQVPTFGSSTGVVNTYSVGASFGF
ncbi:MAG TPA: outer membrane beta-barrel protein [Burkholderiaceae bacterium]